MNIQGLTSEENVLLAELQRKIVKHTHGNRRRRNYYDADYILQQLGVAVPTEFQGIYSILGWSRKAVQALSNRVQFEGVVLAGDSNPYGLQDVFIDNDMALESTLAVTSALKYGPSFLTVTQGDTSAGEPEVLINTRSALSTSVLWNQRLRRPHAGLTVLNANGPELEKFILYTNEFVIEAAKENGRWNLIRTPNPTGRATISVLRYQPDADEDRPLGRSLISRPMMGLVDHAARTMLRSEISSEFYSWPQKYALNTDEEMFMTEDGDAVPALNMAMSAFLRFPHPEKDLDGTTKPEVKVGQFQVGSMEPHTKELEMVAAQFASHANLPVSAMGIMQSQPESSEAMETANMHLIQDAERAALTMGVGFRDAARLAYLVRNKTSELPDDLRRLSARFRSPSQPTQAAAADATVKLVAAGVLPPNSDVTLERLDFSQSDIERLQADRRKAEAERRFKALEQAAADAPDIFRGGEAGEPTSDTAGAARD